KRTRGEKRRSLALRDCLKKVFANEKEPNRRNIEHIADIRDECVHLVITQVPRDVIALFQASVLAYHNRLQIWFNTSISDRVTVGMMTLAYDLSPDNFDLNSSAIRRQIGRESANYLMQLQAELHKEYLDLGKTAEFSIDFSYKLTLTKKP